MEGLFILFIFVGIPAVLSLYVLIGVFHEWHHKNLRNVLWAATIILGELYTYILLKFGDVSFDAGWNEQLYNAQRHQPIWTGGYVTLIVMSLLGVIGAAVLISKNVNKIPPLVSVMCISFMYMALLVQLVWTIQCLPIVFSLTPYLVVPVDIFLIAITIIKEKIKEWGDAGNHLNDDFGKNIFIKKLNKILINSKKWPFYALILFLPLLGMVLGVLILFGQEPDAIIKAWTNTSDWTFSSKVGPQNLYYDEHYLCTVAAGGHEGIVKPLRMGERHGHKVIVNRQLMIANAFENVLEEKTPHFHRLLRNFYDTYGFPIADMIRMHKVACDITYFVMKPLELFFLVVLYIVDINPENRIVVQYLPKKKSKNN
ncbi:DUF6688 domain-containing protein [Butyrivibrio sp. NC3005]|uniref:DUF6688 domain-containing protein n=1 Tax=Butyrivibrio sp. NC3005 TaxID=1280685 RepID=UPI0004008AA6|nr:DUF6688 family protein [Butyrivibrio sp. NC3005]